MLIKTLKFNKIRNIMNKKSKNNKLHKVSIKCNIIQKKKQNKIYI